MASARLDRELRHVLRRCARLSDAEMRLLALVASYSQGCLLSYEEICALTAWSRSKLVRTIRSLQRYGLIEITHRLYKRTTMKIAPASIQLAFVEANDVSSVTHHICATDGTDKSHVGNNDVSPATLPILERELERNIETDNLSESKSGNVDVPRLIANAFPSWNRKTSGCEKNEYQQSSLEKKNGESFREVGCSNNRRLFKGCM